MSVHTVIFNFIKVVWLNMCKCFMHLAETRKIACRMGVIFSRFNSGSKGSAKRARSARHAQRGRHVSRAPRPLCSSFAQKTPKKKKKNALRANRKKKFLTSKVVLTKNKNLVPAKHTKLPITKSNFRKN